METLIANLSGKSRRETLNGREFLVAPVTLIVPGVLNGSRGPLYYPEDEIQKNVESWNGVPLTLDHPKDQSARTPEVLNRQGIGFLFNAKFDKKLTGEAWFDIEKTRSVRASLLTAVEQGQSIEVSTGLFTESEPAPEGSVDNKGRAYSHIARNYRPDHLAILPDSIGACSVKDGCGVLVNEDGKKTLLQRFAEWLGLTDNGMSHDEMRMQLNNALRSRFKQNDPHAFVEEVYDDFIVYSQGENLFQLGYTKSEMGVELSSDAPKKVIRKIDFVAANNSERENEPMAKKELIDGLIANCDCWKEEDRDTLNTMSEDKLKSLTEAAKRSKEQTAVANAAKQGFQDQQGDSHKFNAETGKWEHVPAATKNKAADEPKPLTKEEWLAQAPPEIRATLNHAEQIEQREREQLISQITANVQDKDRVIARLKDKPLDELRDLALLAPQKPEAQHRPSYLGASIPTGNELSKEEAEDHLVMPTINWAEAAKQAV